MRRLLQIKIRLPKFYIKTPVFKIFVQILIAKGLDTFWGQRESVGPCQHVNVLDPVSCCSPLMQLSAGKVVSEADYSH